MKGSVKFWSLKGSYDDSDPKARTSQAKILLERGITISTLLTHLPRSKFPLDRNTGEIIGIKLRNQTPPLPDSPVLPDLPVMTVLPDLPDLPETTVDEEVSDDILERSSMPVRGPGRPKKPIDMVQVLYDELQHSRKTNDKIAECHEGLLPILEKNKVKTKITPWFKKKIWRGQYGEIPSALCPICDDSTISSESFSAGHIIPESRGGPIAIHNIMAICDDCNSQMGTHHLYWFAWHYYSKVFWQV